MVRTATPEHVETVVVGSGFGGSVTAFRLAEAGRDVLVLERGQAYPPGSFARTPQGVARSLWDPSEGMHGLFDVWSLGGIDALVASGLGGGSLIYANVLARQDERWFVRDGAGRAGGSAAARRSRPTTTATTRRTGTRRGAAGRRPWPISRADLEPHYDAVEKMLGASTFPIGRPGYEAAGRAAALREAASGLGLEWQAARLAVSFSARGATAPGLALPEAPYGNVHGRSRTTCELTGECDLGCDYGSKNTLDHTYLSAAAFHGAEIRTRCEVRGIAPTDDGGWLVSYVDHRSAPAGRERDTAALPPRTVRCARVVLAAGALGTTYLLLRNRAALPALSPMLGRGFSTNGDTLGFLIDARDDTGRPRRLGASLAPVVTGAVRVPDIADGGAGPGFYIHDAGYPAFLSWLLAAGIPAADGIGPADGHSGGLAGEVVGGVSRSLRSASHWLASHLPGIRETPLAGAGAGGGLWGLRGGTAASLAGVAARLSRVVASGVRADAAMALLVTGRDVTDGVLRLQDDRLTADETAEPSRDYLERVRTTMAELAAQLGGRFEADPLAALGRTVTVHPLGGAPMGHDAKDGVVDGFGQVFGHPGLYVLDGAAMPAPVGASPALTIAAFADRAAVEMVSTTRRRRRTATTAASARAVSKAAPRSRAVKAGAGAAAAGTARAGTAAGTAPTGRAAGTAPTSTAAGAAKTTRSRARATTTAAATPARRASTAQSTAAKPTATRRATPGRADTSRPTPTRTTSARTTSRTVTTSPARTTSARAARATTAQEPSATSPDTTRTAPATATRTSRSTTSRTGTSGTGTSRTSTGRAGTSRATSGQSGAASAKAPTASAPAAAGPTASAATSAAATAPATGTAAARTAGSATRSRGTRPTANGAANGASTGGVGTAASAGRAVTATSVPAPAGPRGSVASGSPAGVVPSPVATAPSSPN